MDEGSKTAVAFLGIFAFLGLAIFFQADLSAVTNLGQNDNQIDESPVDEEGAVTENVEASTEYTDTFKGELGSEYVFDIETVSIERQDSRNGRLYYRSQLNFELTEFGEQVLQASNDEEVRNLVQERFEKYPEREGFEEDLINDVEAVNDNRIEEIPVEALNGELESIDESDNADVEVLVSFEQGERPEMKWGSFSTVWSMATFDGGDGSSSDPYHISTCQQLQDMQNNLGAHYELVSDVDCSSYTGFSSVGDNNNQFNGVLDGQGYQVENLTINEGSSDYVGLIGRIGSGGEVNNIGLVDADISGGSYYVGGLVGYIRYGSVSNSFSTGNVSGSINVGGLVGYNQGVLENSYSLANVSGDINLGGLVGRNQLTISSSFSKGSVPDGLNVGGLVGKNDDSVSDSYWDNESSGQSSSAGGTGLTTSEITGASASDNMNLDFSNAWQVVQGGNSPEINGKVPDSDGYPILQNLDAEKQLEAQGIDLKSLTGSIVEVNSEGVIQTDENGVVQTTS